MYNIQLYPYLLTVKLYSYCYSICKTLYSNTRSQPQNVTYWLIVLNNTISKTTVYKIKLYADFFTVKQYSHCYLITIILYSYMRSQPQNVTHSMQNSITFCYTDQIQVFDYKLTKEKYLYLDY